MSHSMPRSPRDAQSWSVRQEDRVMVWIAFALRVSRTEQIRISLRIVVERNLKFPIKAERVTERNVRARIFRGDNPACASKREWNCHTRRRAREPEPIHMRSAVDTFLDFSPRVSAWSSTPGPTKYWYRLRLALGSITALFCGIQRRGHRVRRPTARTVAAHGCRCARS